MIIPLFFTIARIMLAPFLLQALCNHDWRIALVLFSFGACSDFFDGFFARYLNQETLLGAALDPFADKIFLLSVFYGLSLQVGYIPYWMIFGMIIKEIVLMLGAAIVLYCIPGFVIKPIWHAKVVTAFSCVTLFLMIFAGMQYVYISENILAHLMNICFAGNMCVLAEYSVKIYAQLKDTYAWK